MDFILTNRLRKRISILPKGLNPSRLNLLEKHNLAEKSRHWQMEFLNFSKYE